MSMVQRDSDLNEEALEVLDRVGIETVHVSAVSAMVKSEVEAQLDAAHKYPRQVRRFLNEAMSLATLDQEIAMSCIYSLPRGGKAITGPSVRLAEICASAYGNLHVGKRVVAIEEKEIVAQGVAWDLEKNLRATVEVRRRITKKDGKRFDDDMITVTGNAAASIGLRNAIFSVVPKAYVNMVYEKVKEVSLGKAMTLSARRATVFERLTKMGALHDRILAKLGRPTIEEVTLDDLEVLIGIGTAIKSGDIPADEAFPSTSNAPEKAKVNIEDIKPGKEQNRGHGNEGLSNVAGKANETKPPVNETKPAESGTAVQAAETKAAVTEVRPGVFEEKKMPAPPMPKITDPEAGVTDEHFNFLEKECTRLNFDQKVMMRHVKEATGSIYSKLQQKHFEQIVNFVRNGKE
jgi:hypothetical protein